MDHVIGINKSVQEVSENADTLRHKERLIVIVEKVNLMLKRKESPISILAYVLHSIPVEQPFSNGNHRTAYILFYEYCYYLGLSNLAEKISLRDEAFVRFLEFLTISELERELRAIYSNALSKSP